MTTTAQELRVGQAQRTAHAQSPSHSHDLRDVDEEASTELDGVGAVLVQAGRRGSVERHQERKARALEQRDSHLVAHQYADDDAPETLPGACGGAPVADARLRASSYAYDDQRRHGGVALISDPSGGRPAAQSAGVVSSTTRVAPRRDNGNGGGGGYSDAGDEQGSSRNQPQLRSQSASMHSCDDDNDAHGDDGEQDDTFSPPKTVSWSDEHGYVLFEVRSAPACIVHWPAFWRRMPAPLSAGALRVA